MIEMEFYIKKLQDLEISGDWKEIYLQSYEKVYPMIYDSHYLRRNFYIKELQKFHNDLMDLPFSPSTSERLKFRKLQKNIIDLLYQVQEENKKIFIAYGSDTHMMDKVCSFLGKLRLNYVVSEEENYDRKVKDFKSMVQDCGYAIILFSADDLGRNINDSVNKVRTSQKVIFQAGYLLSHVGRKNMVILYTEDKEIDSPFDFDDIAFCPFDSRSSWKSELVKAMENSGLYIEKSLVVTGY